MMCRGVLALVVAALIAIATSSVTAASSRYLLGGVGQNCVDACLAAGMNCNPRIVTKNSSAIFAAAGATCKTINPAPWWASDQPSINTAGECNGYLSVPDAVICQGRYPIVQRVCRCDPPRKTTGDIPHPTVIGTGVSQYEISPLELPVFAWVNSPRTAVSQMNHFWMTPTKINVSISYYVDGETAPSIRFRPSMACGAGFDDDTAPWGTKWFGKGARTGAWFWNFQVPFRRSIRVTATSDIKDVLYMIVRGTESAPVRFSGITLPSSARLMQFHTNRIVAPLDFVTVADVPAGQRGYFFQHTISVRSKNLNFLEGCYHAFSPRTAEWPGTIMSTGTEDFFDSAYYFDGGQFHLPVSGFTHLGSSGNNVTWSAYRFHEMDLFGFDNGLIFQWRNGDMSDASGIKCLIRSGGSRNGDPGHSHVIIDAWAYAWNISATSVQDP